ncbi:hypothetical protein LPW11_14685 [Geomonas sp. RF6]|uniref:phenylacetate--CoA ligase family protein n=1 Tax=Geomonas sp. RF6 TaxID=2897342 RepID=UPI001E57F5FA|nr:hypothetical protein [Geomonas sp. RF6]UFS69137.1 hypothetical protein LPW11_14685 [Geomonas sp. RF6]
MKIHKYLYLAGVWLRNRKIFDCYRSLKESEKYDLKTLQEMQLARLQDLLVHAYGRSRFYKNKFDSCGFHPSHIRSLQDVEKIPCSTKEEVLANCAAIQIMDCGERLFYSETSGSTGRPLVFYRNQEWDAWHNASVFRGYSWHQVEPWERSGYLWGYNIAPAKRLKMRLLDSLQNRFRLFSYKDEDVEEFSRKLRHARFLEGYSSMVYEVAKKVNANARHGYNLQMVKGTSEKILEVYQREAQRAFGRRLVSEYGSAEGGIIAFECPGRNMHINMETSLVEVIEEEIVVTNLVSRSFPIIRYKLGDYVRVDRETKCSCGMAHQIITEVTGRVGALIHGKKHTYPSLTLYYVFKNLAGRNLVYNYQVVQDTKGKVVAYLEKKLEPAETSLIQGEFRKYFSDDLEVVIQDDCQRSDFSGKRKDFISTV